MPAPIPFDEIRWTGRREVCDRLAAFLDGSCAGSPRRFVRHWGIRKARGRAVAVLAVLALPEHAGCLARVVLDRRDWSATRLAAAEGLVRLGAELPPDVIDLLVARLGGLLHRRGPWFEEEWPRGLGQFLVLLPFARAEACFRKYVSILGAAGRGQLLVELAEAGAGWEWLEGPYQRWLDGDRVELDAPYQYSGVPHSYLEGRSVPLNARILGLTRHRPESQALLAEYRLRPLDELQFTVRYGGDEWFRGRWEALPPELWTDEEELLRFIEERPQLLAERAARLELPWSALLHYRDAETLLTEIESELRAVSRSDPEAQHYSPSYPPPRLTRALELLARGRDERIDARLASLYLCPELHPRLRDQLYDLIWARAWRDDEDAARAHVRNWANRPIREVVKGQALVRLSRKPSPEDREFFWWAVRHEGKPEFRFQGLRGLEALGEDSPEWRRRLLELASDPDAITRAAAEGALLKRGHAERAARLLETALRSGEPFARVVAIQSLGEHAPARAAAVFGEIAREPDRRKRGAEGLDWADYAHPAALEACHQLARLATPEALASLLQACLQGCDYVAFETCRGLLPAAVGLWEGRDVTVRNPHADWRYSLPWEWRCCGRE